ncbi:hypothetical protein ACVWYU_001765 [Pseudomonas sp. TE12234]
MKKIALVGVLVISMAGCVLQLPATQDPKPAVAQVTEPQAQPPAVESQWIDYGIGEGMSYQLKKGSFRFDQDTTGVALAVALGRVVHQNTNKINALQFYVRAAECVQERGTLAMTDVNGAIVAQVEFMFDAGTIASNIAETICTVAMKEASKVRQQTPQKTAPAKPIGSAI